MQATGKFTEGSILRHVIVMTMAAAFGLTFTFLVDFLALKWITNLGNEEMTASVAIAGNILFLNISVSVALMIPSVVLVSRAFGRGDLELAKKLTTACCTIGCCTVIFTSGVILFFLDPLLRLIAEGADESIIEFAKLFLRIVLPSSPLFAFAMIASAILRAEGDARASVSITLIGAGTALVLDPILIWILAQGVSGAGIVIVIVRLIMAMYAYRLLTRKHDLLTSIREIEFRGFIGPYLRIAIPTLLTQIASPVGFALLTAYTSPFGTTVLAATGVNFRVMLLAFGGVFALSGAIGGIIGQNYAVGRLDRVRETYIKAIQFGFAYSILTWILLMLMRPFIIGLFNLDESGAAYASLYIFCSLHFSFVAVLFVSNAAFNNLGRPIWSTAMNWMRDFVLMLPVLYVMTYLFEENGVIYAQAVVGIMVGTLSGLIGWRYLGQVSRGEVFVERKSS